MHPDVASSRLGDAAWIDPTVAASIFVFSVLLAVVFHKLLFPLLLRLTRWTPTDLDSRILRALQRPITLAIVVLGGFLALTIPLELSSGSQRAVDTIASVLVISLGVIAVASLISKALDWYAEKAAEGDRLKIDGRLFPLFRRISSVLVYGLGALLILGQLGISISPLIAALGLGGLAIALAIQPTLANLFAGTYVMTEGAISAGDYIELENGIAGYVIDVGWRSTRIRTWTNNLVVIPNARFAETIITNYQEPSPAVNVIVSCGVSYDSDLHHVEQVSREVMDEVLDADPNGVREYGRWFGYESFGDSNVDFWLFVRAKDRLASFGLKTALMKRLHQRFKDEGIVINYPVRTLQFPEGWGPEVLARHGGQDRRMYVQSDVPGEMGDGADGGDGPDAD